MDCTSLPARAAKRTDARILKIDGKLEVGQKLLLLLLWEPYFSQPRPTTNVRLCLLSTEYVGRNGCAIFLLDFISSLDVILLFNLWS